MYASYGRLKSLVHPPSSRVNQQYYISQFNTRGPGRDVRRIGRGYEGRGYGRGPGGGSGGRGGRGGRSYGHNPYKFSARTENLRQMTLYTLYTNVCPYTYNMRDREALNFSH